MDASTLEQRIVEAEKDPALIRPLMVDFKAHKDAQLSDMTLLVNATQAAEATEKARADAAEAAKVVADTAAEEAKNKAEADVAKANEEAAAAVKAANDNLAAVVAKYQAVIDALQNPEKSKEDAQLELEKEHRAREREEWVKKKAEAQAKIDELTR